VEIVDDNTEPLIQQQRGRKALYPWDQWLRHNVTVRLVEGVDFKCKPHSIRQQAFNQATNRHGTITTSMGADLAGNQVLELRFRFTDAYIKAQERIQREGDRLMGIQERGTSTSSSLDDDDMEIQIPNRQLDDEVDSPTLRNGKVWGPPS
jgi:hypothetical protein